MSFWAALLSILFAMCVVALCWIHYLGTINIHMGLALWHLNQAERIRNRYKVEEERVFEELKKVKIGKADEQKNTL